MIVDPICTVSASGANRWSGCPTQWERRDAAGGHRQRGRRGVRQAARRRAGARRRADAGAALRHAAAGPARRRRGEGRAPRARRVRAGLRRRRWLDPGRPQVGATFLRNNLDKRSVGIDLKAPEGRDLFARAACRTSTWWPRTSRPARWTASGLGYDDIAAALPRRRSTCRCRASATCRRLAVRRLARVRVDRRGDVGHLRVQARAPDSRRWSSPVGALGDISSAPVRRHRHPRRAAPPRPHRRGPVRRHRDVRRDASP